MLRVISRILRQIASDLDSGNSNLSPEEVYEVLDNLQRLSSKRLSKYSACKYLGISRATFDNYIKIGKIPKGTHELGFKELSWNKKDLDDFISSTKRSTV